MLVELGARSDSLIFEIKLVHVVAITDTMLILVLRFQPSLLNLT